jgi:hypothetical protein
MSRTPVFLVVLAALAPAAAEAACRIKTAKCIEAPESAYVAPHAVGERLEKGTFEVLLNVTYHGLPPSDGSFWYVRTEGRIYKVKPGTFEILEDMTYDAKRLNRYK